MSVLTLDQMMRKAATIAARAHAHQLRKDGTPYFCHPVRVAIRVEGKLAGTVALLHDVIEDCDITLDDLRLDGFWEEVISALDALTRRQGETYFDFITRVIQAGPLAIEVKLADIEDNLEDTAALDPEEAKFFANRYGQAQKRLYAATEG